MAKQHDIRGDIKAKHAHILQRAYDSLRPERKELLSKMSAFRGSIEYAALKALFASTALDEALKDLRKRGLSQFADETKRYDMHPLVRHYAYERLLRKEQAHQALADYFDAVPKPDKPQKLSDLDPLIELYHHTVRAGRLDESAQLFYDRIAKPTYYQFGAYQLCIELLRALFLDGEDALPRLKKESDQAWMLNTIASAYSLSGQPRRAVPLLAMQIAIREKEGNKKGVAIGRGNLANDQLKIGSLRAAEANLRRRIALCREVGDEGSEAIGHQELGLLLAYLGAWADAEQELDTAFLLFDTPTSGVREHWMGLTKSYQAFRSLLLLRDVKKKSIDLEEIEHTIRAALNLAQAFASHQHSIEREFIRNHWLLGATLRIKGQLAEAETHLSEALQRCRANNTVEAEADILLDMARLHAARAQGVAEQNSEFLKNSEFLATEALAIAERSGYVLQAADVHLFLAGLALQTSEVRADLSKTPAPRARTSEVLTSALDHAREALRLATCDGEPYVYRVAYDEAKALVKKLEGL